MALNYVANVARKTSPSMQMHCSVYCCIYFQGVLASGSMPNDRESGGFQKDAPDDSVTNSV